MNQTIVIISLFTNNIVTNKIIYKYLKLNLIFRYLDIYKYLN